MLDTSNIIKRTNKVIAEALKNQENAGNIESAYHLGVISGVEKTLVIITEALLDDLGETLDSF